MLSESKKTSIRIGLTLWSHNQWQNSFYGKGTSTSQRLERYAQVFNTVEGNTTFYATPSTTTVMNWRDATDNQFRFTFKLPSAITHRNKLRHSQQDLHQFLAIMEPLLDKIGQWTIQLPASFSPQSLPDLVHFCNQFPKDVPLGIEVRHLGFFAKNDQEKRFNAFLIENGINRTIMDSRPLFSAPPTSSAVIDGHKKKPKLPVHAIATAENPMIRFIGHPEQAENDPFFQPWLSTLPRWIAEGKQPYLMIHTPDNSDAPELAQRLYLLLQSQMVHTQTPLPDLTPFPASSGSDQLDMF